MMKHYQQTTKRTMKIFKKVDKSLLPSERNFGLFFGFVFAALGYYFWGTTEYAGYLAFVACVVTLLAAILFPKVLRGPNIVWLTIGIVLGSIVSPIIIGLIYFLLFAPMALALKVFGRDEMHIKRANTRSYWLERSLDTSRNKFFQDQY